MLMDVLPLNLPVGREGERRGSDFISRPLLGAIANSPNPRYWTNLATPGDPQTPNSPIIAGPFSPDTFVTGLSYALTLEARLFTKSAPRPVTATLSG